MSWQITATHNLPDAGNDAWYIATIPVVTGALNYGFRVNVGAPLPTNWQLMGYWHFLQFVHNNWVSSRSFPLPTTRLGGENPIIVLNPSDVLVLNVSPPIYALAVSVNRWVPRTTLDVVARV